MKILRIIFSILTLSFLHGVLSSECDVKIDKLEAPDTPSAIGPYSKATRVNLGSVDMISVSGQIGLDPKTGQLVSDDVTEQARMLLDNFERILVANNSSLDSVSKTTIMLTDMKDFDAVNKVYATKFTKTLPARSTYAVKELPKGAKVEIEGVAFVKAECRQKLGFLDDQ